ncbi:MAG: division/cell wall cluster transcriptional repressor MraZ [Alphaproteobacteria bacterium]|nr:division/cell wall cluster transcriptional repressor MraZ [Alphaproteobacteria bacterium]
MSLTTIKPRATFTLKQEKEADKTQKKEIHKMSLFLSSYENRLDTKGRVSVPASFRASIADEKFAGVVLFRSFTHNCIEGLTMSRLEQMAAATDKMGVFDSELDDLTAMLFADARQLAFDVTGRIVIPAELLQHAGIKDTAVFVGRGNSFQIWNPEAFRAAQEKSLENLRKARPNLKIGE